MPRQQPTCILCRATVLTMDPRRPQAEAVAMRHGRLVAVGSDSAVLGLRGPHTAVLDCRGATVVPGFIDAHVHLRAHIGTRLGIDCSPRVVRRIPQLQALLRAHAERLPPGQWLVGHGYDDFELAERRHPTRWDLDRVTPHHPVRLAHRSRHAWLLNSAALAQLGITRHFVAPPGGVVERDPTTGEPTGVLIDMDRYLRPRLPPVATADTYRQGVRHASQELLAAGITTVQDASLSNDLATCDTLQAWRVTGDLRPRVSLLLGSSALPEVDRAGIKPGEQASGIHVQGIKIRLDEASGALYPPQDILNAQVWEAHRRGFPVAVHAVDVPALVSALHAIRLAQARWRRAEIHHRIEHCALCPEVCIDDLVELQVTVVTQPAFLWHHGRRYNTDIDAEQQAWLYRVRSLLERGVPVAGSSDAPVVPPRPLQGIQAAVTRQTPDGQVIGPQERVSVDTALGLFTQGAAWACGLGAEVGAITPGKRADLVVLEADPRRVPAVEIQQIPVRMTLVDGVVQWRAAAAEG
jgi:predicted amidohydrolase YtcJ